MEKKLWCEKRDGSIRKQNLSTKIIFFKEMTIVTSKNHRNEKNIKEI